MHHVAIMNLKFGFLEKIGKGKKKIESRWYDKRTIPWDKIKPNDTVYFKNSGCAVTISAKVARVLQFKNLNPSGVRNILSKYGKGIGIAEKDQVNFQRRFEKKRYCILIFLKNIGLVEPFFISKKGFGSMAAWITISDIKKIKKRKMR